MKFRVMISLPAVIVPFERLSPKHKSNTTYRGLEATDEQLYQILSENGIEALYGDREETPGVRVGDTNLSGSIRSVMGGGRASAVLSESLHGGSPEGRGLKPKELQERSKGSSIPGVNH